MADGNLVATTSTKDRGPNVIILSAAGKPIFVRYGNSEDEWASACGLIQGLRANVISFGLGGFERGASLLGDIQSIKAGKRLIVFKHTEALTLVSISDRKDGNHNEAWLRLQLEYVYSQVIFTLTDQVHSIFKKNPGYDLRSMMGENVNGSIRNLLDRFDPVLYEDEDSNTSHVTGCGSFLTAGVECIRPLPPEIRENASKMLLRACNKCKGRDTLFAILMVGTSLVTIVQPSNHSSQLHTSDINLILTFAGRQPGLLANDNWFPICLPRFDESGFLYAYTSCLDPAGTGLSIVLISHDNSTEQFESFRHSANDVRKNLGLRPVKTKVLRVFKSSTSNASTTSSASTPVTGNRYDRRNSSDSGGDDELSFDSGDDSEKKKTHLDDAAWKIKRGDKDESYDEEEKEDDGKGIAGRIGVGRRHLLERRLSETCYLDTSLEDVLEEGQAREASLEAPLLTALKVALSPKQQEEMMSSYLELASAVHFVFRCDIYVGIGESSGGIGCGVESTGAMLSQCFGPPLGAFPFTDASSQHHVWDVYERLALRLRLGSSSVETTLDALDMISDMQQPAQYTNQDCPMQCLLEAPPNSHSVTYLQEDNKWLFVGLNGKFFELYATLPAIIPPKNGTALCARLVRRLMGDERSLFLSHPITWDASP